MHRHGAESAGAVKRDEWLGVQLPDGSAGVQVGHRIVPLDSISADTMPNEATLMRADANQGALQELYARQVNLLDNCWATCCETQSVHHSLALQAAGCHT